MLLFFGAALEERARQYLRSRDQRAADPEGGAAELLRGDDHGDVFAVTALAVAAVLGRHAEAEHSHLRETGDELLGYVTVVAVHVFGNRSDLVVRERPECVLHHL